MVLNKKGQAGALVFMLAIVVIILALAFIPSVNVVVTNAMANSTNTTTNDIDGNPGTVESIGMSCTSTTDDFIKAGCWIVDLSQSYFIGGLLAMAGVVIAARLLFS
jgi:hypothetical protein